MTTKRERTRVPGIYKTGTGRYEVRWRGPDRRLVSRTFDRLQDAVSFRTKMRRDLDTKAYVDPRLGRMKLDEFWPAFLKGFEKPPSPNTIELYTRHYGLYIGTDATRRLAEQERGTTPRQKLSAELKLGPLPMGSLTTQRVREWVTDLRERGVGEPTVGKVLGLLKAILNRAVDDGIIASSPARSIKRPSTDPDGGLRVLEAEQLVRLAEAHPERFRTLVYLLGYRGPRIGEAAALKVKDLDLMRGRMTIDESLSEIAGRIYIGPTKTGKVRTVSLPPFLREKLAEHLARFSVPTDPEAPVFTMAEGGPLRPNNYRKRVFYRAVRDAGLVEGLTPHDLRDTAATLAFAAGATVKEVSNMLGHANTAITLKRYTGVLDSMTAKTDKALEETFRRALVDFGSSAETPAVVGLLPRPR